MRSHVTLIRAEKKVIYRSFNTASGMRSHVTKSMLRLSASSGTFQYRKRYEITCDKKDQGEKKKQAVFQYRKRYEITCDETPLLEKFVVQAVSIPQAV